MGDPLAGKKILIIGAGLAGLAAALRLSHRGAQVTLLEKNPRPGGKLHLWEKDGFRFDTGPSLLTLPQIFRDLFADVGESLESHLTLVPLNPIQKYIWSGGPDGQSLTTHPTLEATLAEIAKISPTDVQGWRTFHTLGQKIWNLSAELFLYHAPEQLLSNKSEPFNPRKALSLLTIPLQIGMFRRYAAAVDRHIKHPRLREVLYQYATYSGASPFRAPETLAVIPYAESAFGGWYIQGGLYRLAEVLEKLLIARGVKILTNTEATEVLITPPKSKRQKPTATAVRLTTGQLLESDAVLINADVVYAYRTLIPKQYRKKYRDSTLNKLDPGGSALALLLGVSTTYPHLAHHTKFMPADYTSDLRAMFETQTLPQDPCIYVCASTRTDPTQAPPGCENLFILASAPNLNAHIDWQSAAQTYRNQLIQTLEHRHGLTNLSNQILVERIYTPQTLHDDYNANAGSIYGISSNSRRTAFLRPPNRDKEIANLYFAGGATHPGGGLPLVTLSAKIAAELIEEDLS